jgi:hypothetical protein
MIDNLKVWGYTAYLYIEPAKRENKRFSPMAEKLMFIDCTLTFE